MYIDREGNELSLREAYTETTNKIVRNADLMHEFVCNAEDYHNTKTEERSFMAKVIEEYSDETGIKEKEEF